MRRLIRYFGRLLFVSIVRLEIILKADDRMLRWFGSDIVAHWLESANRLYPEYDGEYFYQVPFWN